MVWSATTVSKSKLQCLFKTWGLRFGTIGHLQKREACRRQSTLSFQKCTLCRNVFVLTSTKSKFPPALTYKHRLVHSPSSTWDCPLKQGRSFLFVFPLQLKLRTAGMHKARRQMQRSCKFHNPPQNKIFSWSQEHKGPAIGLECESVAKGALTFCARSGDEKLWQACSVGRGGLRIPDELMFILSGKDSHFSSVLHQFY